MNLGANLNPVSPWLAPAPSDMRVKRDVKFVEEDDRGVRWYKFKYKWSDHEEVGVMAQELEVIAPHLVGEINGMKVVDYARLGEWRP